MGLPDHWHSLGMPELMKEAARAFYGEIPDRENLGELPDGANFWTIEDPLDYMWSADKALRLLTDLPNSRVDLQDMLAGARVKYDYDNGKGEFWYCKTWTFPDSTALEMVVPYQRGPVAYSTEYYPENILVTHERL